MLRCRYVFCSMLILTFLIYNGGFAEDVEGLHGNKITDNSFLIEEAYNQERGVIQHIQTFRYLEKSENWEYSFTQEWPVPGQRHQLSYTIPVSYLNDPVNETNIGDVALNYRYQLLFQEEVALAPRFSTLLPTGDYKEGFGSGALGYQMNIPLSLELSGKLVNHWNMGTTITPGNKETGGADADTFGYNFGTSLIWLVSGNFNLMCEAVWNSPESVQVDGTKTRNDSFFINPGARFAINFESGLQIVHGISFPIGVGPSKDEYGVFLYLSFEHRLF